MCRNHSSPLTLVNMEGIVGYPVGVFSIGFKTVSQWVASLRKDFWKYDDFNLFLDIFKIVISQIWNITLWRGLFKWLPGQWLTDWSECLLVMVLDLMVDISLRCVKECRKHATQRGVTKNGFSGVQNTPRNRSCGLSVDSQKWNSQKPAEKLALFKKTTTTTNNNQQQQPNKTGEEGEKTHQIPKSQFLLV